MGVRGMIPESVAGMVPFIGAVVGSIALFNTIDLLRMWDKKAAQKAISELETLTSSGDSVFLGISAGGIPRTDYHRFIILAGKYRDGPLKITHEHSGAKIHGAIERASYYAEVFRAHGYVWGRLQINRDKKRSKVR